MPVPDELRETVEKLDYHPYSDGDVSADALQVGLLLALVDAIDQQTEALKALGNQQQEGSR